MAEEKQTDDVEKVLSDLKSVEERKQAVIDDLLRQREAAIKVFDEKLAKLGDQANSAKPNRTCKRSRLRFCLWAMLVRLRWRPLSPPAGASATRTARCPAVQACLVLRACRASLRILRSIESARTLPLEYRNLRIWRPSTIRAVRSSSWDRSRSDRTSSVVTVE
jgi:hypothetical protein